MLPDDTRFITDEASLRALHPQPMLRATGKVLRALDKHCRRPGMTMNEGQLVALRRLRSIAEKLGSLYVLLELAVIEEQAWCKIARRLKVDPKTAKTWSLAAIAALAAL